MPTKSVLDCGSTVEALELKAWVFAADNIDNRALPTTFGWQPTVILRKSYAHRNIHIFSGALRRTCGLHRATGGLPAGKLRAPIRGVR
jgi:hypothetical protein